MDPAVCFHLGSSLEPDVTGAAAAGWTALCFNEWFDEDFPDWNAVESYEQQEEALGHKEAVASMRWGRRSLNRTVTMPDGSTAPLEWYELWGLDDLLYLCGLPEDPDKQVRTTYLRGVYEDY